MNKKYLLVFTFVSLFGGVIAFLTTWGLNYLFPTASPIKAALPAGITVAIVSGVLFFLFSKEKKK